MILIIDHFDSFSHNLYQAFAPLSDSVVVRRCDELELKEIESLNPELVVLSPGPRGPKETGITLDYLASPFGQTQATLGICLGLQAMGYHWGIEVTHAKEVVHGKTCELDLRPNPIFEHLNRPLRVARYHSLCLSSQYLPENLELLAEFENMLMAVQDKTRPWVGLQFHPESFLTPQGPELLKNIHEHLKEKK